HGLLAEVIRGAAKGAAVRLRTDLSAGELRELANRAEDATQARRVLWMAGGPQGVGRKRRAGIGGVDRQVLGEGAQRYKEEGAEGAVGLINGKAPGPRPKLSS